MILVTVGTQIPFDRLIKVVEDWAKLNPSVKVIAQIGNSDYESQHIECFRSVQPHVFEDYISKCDFIVSHAGMGSILTALRVKKPIVIFPRNAELGEHRNDHQMATARSFSNVSGVYVASTGEEVHELLSKKDCLESGVLKDSDEYKKLIENITLMVG